MVICILVVLVISMPDYNVQFVGVYMCMTTIVSSKDEESAVADAMELIHEYYGWDLTEVNMLDIEIDELEKTQ